ncbi:ferrochelatase [Nocardioides pacificus]
MTTDARPYDALLLLSFGGPEKTEDVVPFLENVTRGRGISRERLEQVGEHYFLFGGKSPINDQNRAFLAALRADLSEHGVDLPVYWGNRNWDPYLTDALRQMAADGHRRIAVIFTSAYSSYSGCRQYRENLADSVAALRAEDPDAPELQLDRLRMYFNHPGFVDANADATLAAIEQLPIDVRDDAHLTFVTHSVPVSMNDGSGPDGGAYVAQHEDLMAQIVARVEERTGRRHDHALVYCSRSGAPHIPWLEPDVNDHLRELSAAGTGGVVMAPIGFVSDHMEVIYDLDTEAMATAEELSMPAVRAATAGTDARFVATVRELLLERAAAERGESPERAVCGGLGAVWDRCAVDCCPNPRAARPTLAGVDDPSVASA